jgi:hypothetical protein
MWWGEEMTSLPPPPGGGPPPHHSPDGLRLNDRRGACTTWVGPRGRSSRAGAIWRGAIAVSAVSRHLSPTQRKSPLMGPGASTHGSGGLRPHYGDCISRRFIGLVEPFTAAPPQPTCACALRVGGQARMVHTQRSWHTLPTRTAPGCGAMFISPPIQRPISHPPFRLVLLPLFSTVYSDE